MPRTPGPRSVIVVGAGIVGVSAAYFLARNGVDVTVLDESGPAAGATGAADGAVSVASKQSVDLVRLAREGVATYGELASSGVLAGLFHSRPTFLVAANDEEEAVLVAHGRMLSENGVAVELIGRSASVAKLPMIASPKAVARVDGDGHAIGYQIVDRLWRSGGFPIWRAARVDALVSGPAGVAGVVVNGRKLAADAVLVAAGSGSIRLLGLESDTRSRKGQLVVTERSPGASRPEGPLMSARYLLSKGGKAKRSFGLVIDPLRTGQYLLGGTREDGVDGGGNDLAAVRTILGEAVAMLPGLATLRVLRAFSGVRLATRDGTPIVGRVADIANLFVATGFEGDGICLGPAIGRAVQRLICDEPQPVDISAMSPQRFAVSPRFA